MIARLPTPAELDAEHAALTAEFARLAVLEEELHVLEDLIHQQTMELIERRIRLRELRALLPPAIHSGSNIAGDGC